MKRKSRPRLRPPAAMRRPGVPRDRRDPLAFTWL